MVGLFSMFVVCSLMVLMVRLCLVLHVGLLSFCSVYGVVDCWHVVLDCSS